MIIPIAGTVDPPEWAMLELNGELRPPAERGEKGDGNDENSTVLEENHVELGSLHFTEDVGFFLIELYTFVN